MTRNLTEALIAKQRNLGWVDERLAGRIGIDRTTWVHIRNGRQLPMRLVPSVIREFPDLLDYHLQDLGEHRIDTAS